ncbi:hypothetical protein HYPSUDRAFT_101805, partial [Hypholoma sublateritium FD-334 SS-4]
DLVPLILAADEHWWPGDLAALSAVSCAWLFYARKRLYARPAVGSFRAAGRLARTFAANPPLASLVTGISICPVSSTRPTMGEWKAVRQLLALEGLTYMHLGGELAVSAERFLRYIAYPETLEELHVDGRLLEGRLTGRASVEWDDGLGFPGLRKLRLASLDLDAAGGPYRLESLVMEDVQLVGGHLAALVGDRLAHLHITTSDAGCFDAEIRGVLAGCAVGCLHYDTRERGSALLVDAPGGGGFAGLRCLHLEGQSVDGAVLRAVGEACVGLEELVVGGRAVRVTAAEWVDFVGGLGGLRRLGLPGGTNWPPFSAWAAADAEAIRAACRSRVVQLL